MINSIIITELEEAISQSYKDSKQNAWFSAVDWEDEHKIKKLRKNLKVKNCISYAQYYSDFSDEDIENGTYKCVSYLAPQKEDIDGAIMFLEGLVESEKVYDLGINCFAGISRSTALGIVAWCLQGVSVEEALEKILKVRPMAHPNLRILRLASESTGIDMHSYVKSWKEMQKGLLWYST